MIADELSRIAMSPSLANALSRASEHARAKGHPEVTLEHILVALCEDPDAGLVLAASNVDVARLRSDALSYLGGLDRLAAYRPGPEPVVANDLRRILEAAAAAARGGRRREINGAIVLAAVVGDGKSPAAHMLQAQGLTFEGAIRALQRGAGLPARPYPTASTEDILASARERVQSRTVASTRRFNEPVPYEEAAPEEPEVEDFEEAPDYDDAPPAAGRAPMPMPEPEPPEEAPEPKRAPEPPPERRARRVAQEEAPAPQRAPKPKAQPAIPENAPPAPAPSPVEYTEAEWAPPPEAEPAASEAPVPPPLPPSAGAPSSGATLGNIDELRAPKRVGAAEGPTPSALDWLLRAEPGADAEARSAPRQAARAEVGQLVENIPRTMRVAVPVLVEVRIARSEVQALAEGLQGGGAVYHHEVTVTKAMSVRLRAPDGGFFIETASPETQWIEKTALLSTDEFASWRWHVTPRERGRRRLQLIISARTVSGDGLAAETALPDQVITVRVRTNYAQSVSRIVGWSVAALIGGLLARFGEGALDAGVQMLNQLMKG